MDNSGWICLHRKILDNFLFLENRELSRAEAWINLLLLVNHKESIVLIKNETIICKRGQSIRSIETYTKLWNWTPQKVRSFFELLKKNGMIELKSTTRTTILTICNYDKYQDEQQTNNKQITNRKQTNNKQITTNNNNNNDNNDNNDNNKEEQKLIFENIKNETWQKWLTFKKEQFKDIYKSKASEQTAVNKLIELSNNNNELAEKIINQSISNLWKGLFELKINTKKLDFGIRSREINTDPDRLKF